MVLQIDRLIVCPYEIFLCIGAWTDTPVTSPFLLKHDLHISGKPEGRCLSSIIIPLRQTPPGYVRALNSFRRLNFLGRSPYQKSILQELGGLKLRCTFISHHPVSYYTQLTKNRPCRLLEFSQCLSFDRLANMKLPSSFGFNIFMVRSCYG